MAKNVRNGFSDRGGVRLFDSCVLWFGAEARKQSFEKCRKRFQFRRNGGVLLYE